MLTVTLYWTDELHWYLCKLGDGQPEILKKGKVAYSNHLPGLEKYKPDDVTDVFKNHIVPEFDHRRIKLVLFVVPDKFTSIVVEDELHFVKEIDGLIGFEVVRFIHLPIFNGTRALLELKKIGQTFNINEALLIADAEMNYISVFKKTKKGWRTRHLIHGEGKDVSNTLPGVFAEIITFSCGFVKSGSSMGVVFNFFTAMNFFKIEQFLELEDFDEASVIETVIYLSQLHTHQIQDDSCFVPVPFFGKLMIYNGAENLVMDFKPGDVLPKCVTYEFKAKNLEHMLITAPMINSLDLSVIRNKKAKIVLIVTENERLGMRLLAEEDSGWECVLVHEQQLFTALNTRMTIFDADSGYITATYWDNGIKTLAIDVNGLSQIPLKISFFEDVPVVGSAATEAMKPVKHNLIDLLDPKLVEKKMDQGADDLWIDPEGKVFVIVQTKDGLRKVTPIDILAVIVKSVNVLVDKKCRHVSQGVSFFMTCPEHDQEICNDTVLQLAKMLKVFRN